MKPLLESEEQKLLIQWAQYVPIVKDYLIHYPLGGKRHLLEAISLKKQGAKKGVSDLFLAYPTAHYAGLWIELKRNDKKARLTKEQIDWLNNVRKVGYAGEVAYGFEEAKEKIMRYLFS